MINVKSLLFFKSNSVVRSVKWGDGSKVFVTASDPFTSRDLGCITVFSYPPQPPETLNYGILQYSYLSYVAFVNDEFIQMNWIEISKYLYAIVDTGLSNKDDPAGLLTANLIIEVDDNDKATCLGWTIGDEFIIAGFDSGNIVKYDAVTGKVCQLSSPFLFVAHI